MTSSTLPLPLVSEEIPPQHETKKAKRKRFQRASRTERARMRVTPTVRQGEVLSDLLLWGFAKMQALFLTAYSNTETPLPVQGANKPKQPETGMMHFTKTWKHLVDKGYASKFNAKGRYVSGSEYPIYAIEDGKGMALGELHLRRRDVLDAEWDALCEDVSDIRDLVIATMTALGFEADLVKRIIHNNSDLAIKFVSTEISGVDHKVLCSQFLSILWFGARQRGITVEHPLPDGQCNFSFKEFVMDGNVIQKDADGKEKTKNVIIEPDAYFDISGDGFAIEAETGASGRPKIEQKVENFLKLWKLHGIDGIKVPVGNPDLRTFRVLFYCATAAHARMILDVIADKTKGKGSGLFLVTTTAEFHLGDEPRGERWHKDSFLKNLPTASGERLYSYLANRIAKPLCWVVTGRDEKGFPVTRQVALLPA